MTTPSNTDLREAIAQLIYNSYIQHREGASFDDLVKEVETLFQAEKTKLMEDIEASKIPYFEGVVIPKRQQELLSELLGELPEKRMEAFSKGGLIPVDADGKLDSKDIPWAANTGFNECLTQVVAVIERKRKELT